MRSDRGGWREMEDSAGKTAEEQKREEGEHL